MADHLRLTTESLDRVCTKVTSERINIHLDRELCKKLTNDFLIPAKLQLANFAARSGQAKLKHYPQMLKKLYRVAHRAHVLVERCCEEDWWRTLFTQGCASHCEEALDFIDDLQWCIAEIWKIGLPRQPLPVRHHFKKSFKQCEEVDRIGLLMKLEDLVSERDEEIQDGFLTDFQLSRQLCMFLLERIKVQVFSNIPIDRIQASLDYRRFNFQGYNGCSESLGKGSAGSVIDVELQEFAKQALKLSKLSHPHVVKLFGFYSEKRSDEPHKGFFLMELMSGSLYAEMQKGSAGEKNPFHLRVAVDIMTQIAKGVRYLHEYGVSHRDLKCDNVLVKRLLIPSELANTPSEDYYDIKVTDFDQAKFLTSNSSDLQSLSRPNVGTTQWRAPECYAEKGKVSVVKVNPKKADSYSFAMTCYELLSVEDNPFDALPVNGMTKQKEAILAGMRPPIPEGCPKLLKNLIEDCWQNEAGKRPTFDEICKRLQDVQSVLLTGTLSKRNRLCDGASASLKQPYGGRMMSMFKHMAINAANARNKFASYLLSMVLGRTLEFNGVWQYKFTCHTSHAWRS
jgi:serine/threonine protein kinase